MFSILGLGSKDENKSQIFTPHTRNQLTAQPNTPSDFQWINKGSNGFTEGQSFYCFLDNGAYIMFQPGLSLVGISQVCQITIRYFCPKTNQDFFKSYSYSGSDVKFDPTNTNFWLTNGKLNYTYTADGAAGKYDILFCESEIQLQLEFKLTEGAFKFGDGITMYGGSGKLEDIEKKQPPYIKYWYCPKATTSGTLNYNGESINISGSGSCFNTYQNMMPGSAGDNWQLALVSTPRIGLIMLQGHLYHSKTVLNEAMFTFVDPSSSQKYTVTCPTASCKYREIYVDQDTNYHIPTKAVLSWEGTTPDGKNVKLSFTIVTDQKTMKRVHILASLPWVARKVIEAVIANPYIYQFCQDVTVELTIDGNTIKEDGKAFFELSYFKSKGMEVSTD